jgi:superfamily II DNA or RNA helicase
MFKNKEKVFILQPMPITPRPYQHDCRDRVRASFASGHRAPLMVLPTGGGKTIVFSDIAARTIAKGNSVCVLVHRQELIRQASEKLTAYGVQHGIISPHHARTPNPVQVASVWTLVRRLDKTPPPALLIIDEAHHSQAQTWRTIIDAWPRTRLLGVTATPTRLDGTGLGVPTGYFDDLIIGPSVKELIAQDYLTPPLCYGPSTAVDLTEVHTVAGDYDKHEIGVLMDKPTITGCAVEHYNRICPGVPFIAFAVNVAHAEHIAEKFNSAGIACMSIDGTMDDHKRKYILDSLQTGKIRGVASCDLISEGFDVPLCGCCVLLRPTQSEGLFLQQVGRGLRKYPDRTHAYILDHVGNCRRHGLPTAPRNWTLTGEKRQKRKKAEDDSPPVRQCPKCFMWYDSALGACPGCGEIYVPKKREINQVDGELKLLIEDSQPPKKRFSSAEGQELRKLIIQAQRQGLPKSHAFKVFYIQKRQRARAAELQSYSKASSGF